MKYCNNCGNQLNENASFCAKCGNTINNQVVQPITNQKKETIDYINLFANIGLLVITALFIFVLCLSAGSSPNTDGSVSGLYIIFGIPFGLAITCVLPFINTILSGVYLKKKSIGFPIVEIILDVINIPLYIFFYIAFCNSSATQGLFIITTILYVLLIIGVSIVAIITIIKNKKK